MAIQIFETGIDKVFIVNFLSAKECATDKTPTQLKSFLDSNCEDVILYNTEERIDFTSALMAIKIIVQEAENKNTLIYLVGHGGPDHIRGKKKLPDQWDMYWKELLPFFRDINYATGNRLFLNTMFVCHSAGMLESEEYTTDCFRFFFGTCKNSEGLGDLQRHATKIFPCYSDRRGLYKMAKESQDSFSTMRNPQAFCVVVNENFSPLLDNRERCNNEALLQTLIAKQGAGYHIDERMISTLKKDHPTYKITLASREAFLGLIFHEIDASRLLTQDGNRSLRDVIARMQMAGWTIGTLAQNSGFNRQLHHPEWFDRCVNIYENFNVDLFSPIFLQDAKNDERKRAPGSGYYLLDGTRRSLVLAWKLIVEDFPYIPIEAYVFRPRAY